MFERAFVVAQLFVFDKLGRTEVESAEAGDIVALVGLEGIEIGDTIVDPEYLQARARLAFVHLLTYWLGYDRVPERVETAREIHRAMRRVAPDDPATHYVDGYLRYYGEERWRRELTPETVAAVNRSLDAEVMAALGYEVLDPAAVDVDPARDVGPTR